MASEARNNIPSPRGLPFLGNVFELESDLPIRELHRLLSVYGPIVKLNILGQEQIIVGDVALLEECCDETRFRKGFADGIDTQRNDDAQPKGLFSTPWEEGDDWQIAHRVLMPAFGPLAIQAMFPEMLVLKWARMGPSYRIPVTAEFTRLTLDTIALCAMGYRFNSFYHEEPHPFVQAVNNTLATASDRAKVGPRLRKMMPWDTSAETVRRDSAYLAKTCNDLVRMRRESPKNKQDLLNAMVYDNDTKTGEAMSDGLIIANMLTFLVAGHETTSALLSFAFLYLLKNPETYFKAQQEIDHVIGTQPISPAHLKDLYYINAVLRETLRLAPPAPTFTRVIRRDKERPNRVELIGGGKYEIRESDKITCVVGHIQRDPKIYGSDSNDFNPDRMLDEKFAKLPQAAWKPFGNGIRSCIGRPFAWQEALLTMALILQNFNLRLDDPAYTMKIKQTITIEPLGFYLRATLRDGMTAESLQARLFSTDRAVAETIVGKNTAPMNFRDGGGLEQMTILYGSNTGTCQTLAYKLSVEAGRHGRKAKVIEMDAGVGQIPNDQPVIIITSSYEGDPPDNAAQFVAWLEAMDVLDESFAKIEYAVFGCGNAEWVNTYQRIPTLVDSLLAKHAGKRIAELGFANAKDGDIFGAFIEWAEQSLWPAIGRKNDIISTQSLDIEISVQHRASFLRQDVVEAAVVETRLLTAQGEPEKRHMKIKLPEGMKYETGDYLAVLPLNSNEEVQRVMKLFEIPRDATLRIKSGSATFLPTGTTLAVFDILKGYVELRQPATKQDLQICIDACDRKDTTCLESITRDDFYPGIANNRTSLLDLLTTYASIKLPFSTFLGLLPALRPRHYSISSSSLASPEECTITFGVINESAKAGIGRFVGVTGSYLATLQPGDGILVSVRAAANRHFRLPADQENTPLLMFGAGTGLAPFRGFMEERATQNAAGKTLAPAVLILGCRSSTADRLYAEEMDEWSAAGIVDIRYTFSREPAKSSGCKYIHERFIQDKETMRRMWDAGAKVYTCCAPNVAAALGRAMSRLLIETARNEEGLEISEAEADAWFKERKGVRIVTDVFA